MLSRKSVETPDEPGERPTAPATAEQRRARFFNSGNAFNVILPEVPRAHFVRERDLAMDPAAPTGLVAMDLSDKLRCDFPATTPLVLARYAVIRAGEELATRLKASCEFYYVIGGRGTTESGEARIAWAPGDIFALPGGQETRHRADAHAVLWLVTNEPQLSLENLEPPQPGRSEVEATHFLAADIDRQVDQLIANTAPGKIPGYAVVLASENSQHRRNLAPTLTLAMNSLPPGAAQRAHVHNSIAVTLCVQGEGCWSMVDGKRGDWQPWATSITPPTAEHSHHNGGDKVAKFLIVQDGGIYYHCRTMGFAFTEPVA